MKSLFLGVVALVSGVGFAGECANAFELRAQIKITDNYLGQLNDEDIPESDREKILMKKGEKVALQADMDLRKETKTRCEYKAINLSINGVTMRWTDTNVVDAYLDLKTSRLSVGSFIPKRALKVKTTDGTKTRRVYYGNRSLHLVMHEKDDTETDSRIEYEGKLAFFNFSSEGHQYFGDATGYTQQD